MIKDLNFQPKKKREPESLAAKCSNITYQIISLNIKAGIKKFYSNNRHLHT